MTTPTTVAIPETARPAAGGPLAVVLSLLTVSGPISMDLYLPVLPALTHDLGAATSAARLTVTTCLFGLAGGQLVAGPLSDRFGRRRPHLPRGRSRHAGLDIHADFQRGFIRYANSRSRGQNVHPAGARGSGP